MLRRRVERVSIWWNQDALQILDLVAFFSATQVFLSCAKHINAASRKHPTCSAEPVSIPDQVRDKLSPENAPIFLELLP
jgi:hypothetical protein